MSKAYIALGSNIMPRSSFINSALKKINQEEGITLKRRSSTYDTYPLGDSSQARYLNSVIEIETSLKPQELLSRLSRIENSLGRRRIDKNRPRTIDLDILLYGDAIFRKGNLIIPHPRMHKRDFILFGMNEIAPTAIHPILKKCVQEIHDRREMKLIKSPQKAYNYIASLRQKGKRIGFVPTMGHLHEGHLSLIRKARKENDVVVISIFVNPTQFGPREDYKRYPRNLRRDIALAKKEGLDIVFYPDVKEMYAPDHSTYVDVEKLSENLCGRLRRGHFRGVATIVTKLFNIIPSDNAYFGQKDAQQAFLIKRIARDLNIPVNIKILPIVREKDGLAMSSRNTYLNERERQEATILFKSLLLAKELVKKGERNKEKIIEEMRALIASKSSPRIEYISMVDTDNLKDVQILQGKVLIALAAYFGKTRLIDNIIVNIGKR
jgi:pantoate--beta-alanine ligase